MNLYSNIKKKLNESEDYEANRNDIIKQAAEYIFNDVDGDWDSELIDYERFTDYYMDLNKRDFNKAIKLVQEALGNFAEHHYFDRDYNNISKNGALLELNDNHTMWELNNPTLDNDDSAWQLWDAIVTDKIDEFKDSTGEELYGCGRSGRHICVEPTFENCLNFNKLQEFQENLEDAAVEEFNNYRAEEFNESRKEIHETEEEIDQHLLALVTKKKDLLTDDTIDDDTAYDLMERIDNELINSYSIEEIEKAEKLVGLDESETEDNKEKTFTIKEEFNSLEKLQGAVDNPNRLTIHYTKWDKYADGIGGTNIYTYCYTADYDWTKEDIKEFMNEENIKKKDYKGDSKRNNIGAGGEYYKISKLKDVLIPYNHGSDHYYLVSKKDFQLNESDTESDITDDVKMPNDPDLAIGDKIWVITYNNKKPKLHIGEVVSMAENGRFIGYHYYYGWSSLCTTNHGFMADLYKAVDNRDLSKDYLHEFESNYQNGEFIEPKWFKNKKLYNEFKKFVDTQLQGGRAIDDPDYVNTLSPEEYESLLVNTWMKDQEEIDMFEDLIKNGYYGEEVKSLVESENTLFCIQDTSHPDFANKGYQTTQFDDLITFTSKDDAQKYINYLNTLDKDEYKIVDATTFNKDKMVVFNTFDEYKKSLKESETEDYWDATELERKGFCALLKFNHPEKHMNPSMRYIITNDNNEVYRFAMQGSTEQIKDTGAKIEFRKYLNSNGLTESESLKESQTQEIEEIIADIRKEVPKIDEYLDAYYKKINAEEPKPKAFIKNKEMTINPDWEDWYRNTSNILYNEAAWDKFVAWVKKNYNVDINLNEAEGPYNQAFKVGSKLDLLLSELNTALLDGLKAIGYDEEFKKDYTSIEAKENENNIEIYFIAELDYEEGENIVYYHLDDVLEKYDKDAYFEASTSGRWIAVINKNMLNEAEGYIKPEEFDSMNDEDLDEYLKFLQSEWTYHTKKRQAEIGNEIDLIEKILTDRGFYIDTSNPDYNSLYFDMDGNQIDKNGNQIPENEPEITDRPKEGFVVFQTTKKEDDPQELEDIVFTSKEEAKEALEEWKNSYTDEEKEQFNPSGIIYKYKGKTPREINASKAQIAQELR